MLVQNITKKTTTITSMTALNIYKGLNKKYIYSEPLHFHKYYSLKMLMNRVDIIITLTDLIRTNVLTNNYVTTTKFLLLYIKTADRD